MLGDLILFIKEKVKQHITCSHNYIYRQLSGVKDYQYVEIIKKRLLQNG